MRFKIVDDRYAKGIILTAESLLDLRDDIEGAGYPKDQKEGALNVYNFLKSSYDKAHKPSKW